MSALFSWRYFPSPITNGLNPNSNYGPLPESGCKECNASCEGHRVLKPGNRHTQVESRARNQFPKFELLTRGLAI